MVNDKFFWEDQVPLLLGVIKGQEITEYLPENPFRLYKPKIRLNRGFC